MDGIQGTFPLYEFIGIFACILASAFFSGTETALTRLSDTKIYQLIDSEPRKYGILTFWLESKRRILAGLLIGNNIVNILCSILGYRVALYFIPNYAEALSVFTLTITILIFAEITPKSLALHYAEPLAVPLLRLVWLVDKLLWVVSAPLARIPQLILSKTGETDGEPTITEDEIEYQIRLGHDRSVFEEEAQGDLLISAVEFSEIGVKEVMVPRTDIFGLNSTTSIEQAVEAVIESGHSRIPVYQNNLDNIIGLLHAKDLLQNLPARSEKTTSTIEDMIRTPPMFAPETQKINNLLAKMRHRRVHMAIVVDEFGGTAGLITLEDIIEELVGEIQDEFDAEDSTVRKIDSKTWIVDAHMSVNDLKDATGIDLPNLADYESVGGYVVFQHGSIPKPGAIVTGPQVKIKVLVSDERHVERVEIRLEDEPTHYEE